MANGKITTYVINLIFNNNISRRKSLFTNFCNLVFIRLNSFLAIFFKKLNLVIFNTHTKVLIKSCCKLLNSVILC